MSKKNTKNRDYWEGVPEELKYMCLIEARGCHYCTQAILKYLIDRSHDCDSSMSGVTATNYLIWVDRAFESSLYPLYAHEDDWSLNIDSVEKILKRAEQLLQRTAPEDYKTGHRTWYDEIHEVNTIELAQHLDVYLCTLYMYTGDWSNFEARLETLLEDTERNVQHLLSHESAEEYVGADDWADEHYPGMDIWEPLKWFCREYLSNLKALKCCVQVYERYALFLQEMSAKTWQKNACMKLRYVAENRLRALCELITEGIEDDIEFDNEDASSETWSEEIEKYENKIWESKKRNSLAISKGDGFMYHQKNADFTQKLRSLMAEYPTMPVVVTQFSNIDCDIAELCDSETGAFRERIIAIYEEVQDDRASKKHVKLELGHGTALAFRGRRLAPGR